MADVPLSRSNRIGVRELRTQIAAVLRRAQRGDRVVITADGVPIAQLTSVEPSGGLTLDDLVAGGLVTPPGRPGLPAAPARVRLAVDVQVAPVLDEVRGR